MLVVESRDLVNLHLPFSHVAHSAARRTVARTLSLHQSLMTSLHLLDRLPFSLFPFVVPNVICFAFRLCPADVAEVLQFLFDVLL